MGVGRARAGSPALINKNLFSKKVSRLYASRKIFRTGLVDKQINSDKIKTVTEKRDKISIKYYGPK
jgi:hypothetical protein